LEEEAEHDFEVIPLFKETQMPIKIMNVLDAFQPVQTMKCS
jgi:hypothetical protein